MNKQYIKAVSILTLTAALGGVVGYSVARATLKSKYEAIADEAIEEVKATYKVLHKDQTPEEMVREKYGDGLDRLGYTAQTSDAESHDGLRAAISRDGEDVGEFNPANYTAEELNEQRAAAEREQFDRQRDIAEQSGDTYITNIFNTVQEDPGEPLPFQTIRIDDAPYVISFDEFMDEEKSYRDVNLTYWDQDGKLSTDASTLVDNIERTVSSKALEMFGKGSNDPETVYVRNEDLGTDFEITLDKRSFVEVVLNYVVPEEKNEPRKMRDHE